MEEREPGIKNRITTYFLHRASKFTSSFSFISLILLTTAGVLCLCGGCKKSPRTTSLCSHIFSGP